MSERWEIEAADGEKLFFSLDPEAPKLTKAYLRKFLKLEDGTRKSRYTKEEIYNLIYERG